MPKILAIDIGTLAGWALYDSDAASLLASGSLDLSTSRFESSSMRYIKFRAWVLRVIGQAAPDLFAYEEVRRHVGTTAAHVYGGFVAILTTVLEDCHIPYMAVPVGTIKRVATGKGNSKKDAMKAAALAKFGLDSSVSFDECDAIWCAVAAAAELQK